MLTKSTIQGMVVKVTETFIVLLCQDGTFKNVPRPNNDVPLIGESYIHVEKNQSFFKYVAMVSVVLLALISYLFIPGDNSTYVVAIDINPSIELTVDDKLNIIKTAANNEDGEALLASLNLKNTSLPNAMEEIVLYSVAKNLMIQGEEFLATTVIPLNETNSDVIAKIEASVKSVVSQENLELQYVNESKATYETAKNNKMSVNHYVYYQRLEQGGIVNSIEDIKGKKIADLKKMEKAAKKNNGKDPIQNNRKNNEKINEKKNNLNNSKTDEKENKQDNKQENKANNSSEKKAEPKIEEQEKNINSAWVSKENGKIRSKGKPIYLPKRGKSLDSQNESKENNGKRSWKW